MCSSSWNSSAHDCSSSLLLRQHNKKSRAASMTLRVRSKSHGCMRKTRLRPRKKRRGVRRGGRAEEEVANVELYLANRCLMAENERLRETARLLRRENLALRATLISKSSTPLLLQ